jgi:hypothetical protein
MFSKRRGVASFAFIVLMLAAFSLPLVAFVPTVKAAVLYDSGDPTPAEQLVLEYVNRARSDTVAEGQRLGIDIHEGLPNPSLVGPRPPLAMNKNLLGIAEAHSRDMYNLNYFSHNDTNGTTPFDRMTHAGYDYVRAGENMAASGADQSATELEDFMMEDAGTVWRPHRVNLLDLINPYPCGGPPCVYSEVGIGYYEGATPNGIGLTSLITEDFGAAANTGPFLLGVVYNDRNSNNFYDIGEGIAGITITTSSGDYYAVSSSSGGYTIPIGTSETISVTASGPSFGPITKTVTLSGTNIKLDFTSQTSSETSFQSTTQTSLEPIMFQSTPSSFVGATSPGTITACGNTFLSGQSTSNCGSSFTATANLPTPATGWQFDHWIWAGGVTCSSNTANPTSCSALGSGGALMAVYGAQLNFVTNPASSALISWGSCSNQGQGNGVSFFSTSYGSAAVTACYVPSGYKFSSWSCSGGLICSGSNNPTIVTFTGPGTITLNLQTQTINPTSTTRQVTSSLTAFTLTVMSSSTSTAVMTTSTYATPEFGAGQTVILSTMFVAVILVLIRRNLSRKR